MKKRSGSTLTTCPVLTEQKHIVSLQIYNNERFAEKLNVNGFYMGHQCDMKEKMEKFLESSTPNLR